MMQNGRITQLPVGHNAKSFAVRHPFKNLVPGGIAMKWGEFLRQAMCPKMAEQLVAQQAMAVSCDVVGVARIQTHAISGSIELRGELVSLLQRRDAAAKQVCPHLLNGQPCSLEVDDPVQGQSEFVVEEAIFPPVAVARDALSPRPVKLGGFFILDPSPLAPPFLPLPTQLPKKVLLLVPRNLAYVPRAVGLILNPGRKKFLNKSTLGATPTKFSHRWANIAMQDTILGVKSRKWNTYAAIMCKIN